MHSKKQGRELLPQAFPGLGAGAGCGVEMGWGVDPSVWTSLLALEGSPEKTVSFLSHQLQPCRQVEQKDSLAQGVLPLVLYPVLSLNRVTKGDSSTPSRMDFCKTGEAHL